MSKFKFKRIPGTVDEVMLSLVRKRIHGEIDPWMAERVHSIRHVPVEEFEGLAVETRVHVSPECGGTRQWVADWRIGGWPTRYLPEVDHGDNGEKWASDFSYNSAPLFPGVERLDDYCRDYLEDACLHGEAKALFMDLPVFYRHEINPLPRLRQLWCRSCYPEFGEIEIEHRKVSWEVTPKPRFGLRLRRWGAEVYAGFPNPTDPRHTDVVRAELTPAPEIAPIWRELFDLNERVVELS